MIKLPDNLKELSDFLSEPTMAKQIREALSEIMFAMSVTHKIVAMPELAHVDPEIIEDMRYQSYKVFERCGGLSALIHIIVKKQANEFILKMFAESFTTMVDDEESLRRLCKTTINTYAPGLWEKMK